MFWFALIIIITTLIIYQKILKPHKYWTNKNVIQNKQVPIFGDFWEVAFKKKSLADFTLKLYNNFKGEKVIGTYQFLKPVLMVRDPHIIKEITVRDFENFADHMQIFHEDEDDFWTNNLFFLNGQKWKNTRNILTPAFTGSKMKVMFELMYQCADKYVKNIINDVDKMKDQDVKLIFSKYSNDVIASTAFGINIDSYKDNNDFYNMGKVITTFSGFWMTVKFSLTLLCPKFCHKIGIHIFSDKIKKFFQKIVVFTIKNRQKFNISRPDLIQLLLEARKEIDQEPKQTIKTKEKLSDNDITAHAMMFFFAAFDNISAILSFVIYELAINTECQEKLINEIDKINKSIEGNITYETLTKMKYLDMVVSEALRLYPTAVVMNRKCTKAYTLKIDDGKTIDIEKDTAINIPVFGIQRDPQFYTNPNSFDPERFSDENKEKIHPYAYIPFGAGPRNCIGNRFALLETKIMLFLLFSKLKVSPNSKTAIPIKLSTQSFTLQAESGIYLDFNLQKQ